jgi:hypothetical protein
MGGSLNYPPRLRIIEELLGEFSENEDGDGDSEGIEARMARLALDNVNDGKEVEELSKKIGGQTLEGGEVGEEIGKLLLEEEMQYGERLREGRRMLVKIGGRVLGDGCREEKRGVGEGVVNIMVCYVWGELSCGCRAQNLRWTKGFALFGREDIWCDSQRKRTKKIYVYRYWIEMIMQDSLK